MARKRSKTDQAKIAVNRLLRDEEVQRQLRNASTLLSEAWSRASARSASKAVGDKKIYDKVRDAATSLARAARLMRKQPEPPKHTGRKVAVGAAVAGGAVFAAKKKMASGSSEPEFATPSGPTPVAAVGTPGPAPVGTA